jgi:hypothetical protein
MAFFYVRLKTFFIYEEKFERVGFEEIVKVILKKMKFSKFQGLQVRLNSHNIVP